MFNPGSGEGGGSGNGGSLPHSQYEDPNPVRSFQDHIHKSPPSVGSTQFGIDGPIDPSDVRNFDRAKVQRMRALERGDDGVPFWLDRTLFEARVRPISFADRTMIEGISPRLQNEISQAINSRGNTRNQSGNVTVADMLQGLSTEERLSNAMCVAGFVYPRLTLTKQEADEANDPFVWWVGELHIEERRKYSNLVLGQDAGEARRIANFLADRVSHS